jgi:hypothetical protein
MKVWKIGMGAALALGLAAPVVASDSCQYQGTKYSEGSTTCQSGSQYRCDDGEWKSLGVGCPAKETKACDFEGSAFSSGTTSCQAGVKYRCEDGNWRSLETACAADQGTMPHVVAAPGARTCMLEGSTVSNASTVCKSGTMYVCDDGDWRNLGTPCR